MKDRRIKILADCPPPLDVPSLMNYKESGIDIYVLTEDFLSYDKNTKDYIKALELLNNLNIDVYVRGLGSLDKNYYDKFLDMDFNRYPCIKGLYITDEPNADLFDNISNNYVEWRNNKYPNLFWHLNLYPSYAGAALKTVEENGKTAYENYLIQYAEKVLRNVSGAKDISFDHYPLLFKENKPVMGKNWLLDTYFVAEMAKSLNVDFCACIQAFTDGNGWRVIENESYVRFQFNTYLAFGVNMFEIFIYREVTTQAEGTFKGMTDFTGLIKTDYYGFVKDAIARVRNIEELYLQYKWVGIVCQRGRNCLHERNVLFDAIKDKTIILPNYIRIESNEDCLVGFFENGEKNALMLVNFNDPSKNKSCRVCITLDKKRIKSVDNKEIEGDVSSIFDLQCGDGVFVELE